MISFLPEFTFLLPFLFTFAVVFGVISTLKNVKKTSDGKTEESEFMPKNVNAIIALVFGFVSASYEPFANLIMQMLPVASALVVVLFLFILIKKIFDNDIQGAFESMVLVGILLLAVGTFWGNLSGFMSLDYSFSKDVLWIIGLVFVGALFYLGYKKS